MAEDGNSPEMLVRWLETELLQERAFLEARHRTLVKTFENLAFGEDGKPRGAGRMQPSELTIEAPTFQPHLSKSDTSNKTVSLTRPSEMAQTPVDPSRLKAFQRSSRTESKGGFHDVVVSKLFEYFFGFVIVLNVIIMSVESQYTGLGVGHQIGFEGFREPNYEVWPGAEMAFVFIDYFFGILYTIELIAKVFGLRCGFWERWNMFDALIVVVWYMDKILTSLDIPIDLMILRILRLARLLRLIRLARQIAGFDQLFVMFVALRGSGLMLGWTFLMLFSCQLIFALLLSQSLITYYIKNDNVPDERKIECFRLFGTFARAMFSMYELTLANWPPIGRFLMDDVSEFFVVFTILYKVTFGFAVIAVIQGCFIKETFKAVDSDDLLMILHREKEARVHNEKMKLLLEAADTSEDGSLSYDEFVSICQTNEVKSWLGAQGLDASDASQLFKLIDDGDGDISIDDLVQGVKRLKGPARSLDFAFEAREALRRERAILRQLRDIAIGLKIHQDVNRTDSGETYWI